MKFLVLVYITSFVGVIYFTIRDYAKIQNPKIKDVLLITAIGILSTVPILNTVLLWGVVHEEYNGDIDRLLNTEISYFVNKLKVFLNNVKTSLKVIK